MTYLKKSEQKKRYTKRYQTTTFLDCVYVRGGHELEALNLAGSDGLQVLNTATSEAA